MKKSLLIISSLILLTGCNPELQNIGASENDLIKYFKITSKDQENPLGEGYLIIAHVGEKRLLTYYLKNKNGFSHNDVSLKRDEDHAHYVKESVTSLTPDCQIAPDYLQPNFYEYLNVEGVRKTYKLESTTREEAMAEKKKLNC